MTSAHDPETGREGPGRVARLLELAVHNAEQLLAEARAEAEQLRSEARKDADAVLAVARHEAERVHAALEESRAAISADIAGLLRTQQEHRERLRVDRHAVLDQPEPTEAV